MSAAIKQRIDDARSILIVPKQEGDLDVLAASFALARSMHVSGKKLSMYIDPDVYTEVLKAKFPPQNISFMKKNEPGNIVISLDNVDAPVKEVKWKEEKGTVNIYVTTEGGDVPGDKIRINQSTHLIDLVVMVDASSPEDLGDFYRMHRQQFAPERVAIFTPTGVKSPDNVTGYEIRTASFSQGMFEFMQRESMHVDEDIATTLLAGLYWKTENFSYDLNDDSFGRAAELTQAGADQELARNIANRTLSLHDTRYFADIYSHVVAGDNGIFYTIVPERQTREKELFTDHVPVAGLIGCRAAFTVVHGSSANTVYIKANSGEINLEAVVDKYKGSLSRNRAVITSQTAAEALAQDIVSLLNSERKEQPVLTPEEAKLPAPTEEEKRSGPDHDFEKTRKWLDEMSKQKPRAKRPSPRPSVTEQRSRRAETPAGSAPESPREVQEYKAEPPAKKDEKYVPERAAPETHAGLSGQPVTPAASTPAAEAAPDEFSPSPITPTISGDDPLAPAVSMPEPLDLDGKRNQQQQPDPSFAPNTPLPPASI
ncbi:MAG: hypothetical protein TR69_WS6001000987 [candidate division WS6 bacterium OLB20]|uniref:Uncharacterized protein n=1 Tax=candidate division WS6 bacterium OLB20 TaxID=1617426 RepID=A0A136LZ94_9BACT|nr:MAG: hypothetical protein TR69_WS6001000987 [candidate division WS6 bacterium OLB20]